MTTIEKTRVIRPSSRKVTSSYKVGIEKRGEHDDLHLTVTHESDKNFKRSSIFRQSAERTKIHSL